MHTKFSQQYKCKRQKYLNLSLITWTSNSITNHPSTPKLRHSSQQSTHLPNSEHTPLTRLHSTLKIPKVQHKSTTKNLPKEPHSIAPNSHPIAPPPLEKSQVATLPPNSNCPGNIRRQLSCAANWVRGGERAGPRRYLSKVYLPFAMHLGFLFRGQDTKLEG